MARPKNTKTTKWLIHRETWHATRKEAIAQGRSEKLPYDVKNLQGSKTYFGSYRRSTWRCRTYSPSIYRGHQPSTTVLHTKKEAERVRPYHKNCALVKIRGGSYLFLKPEVTVHRKKKSARARR